MKFSSVTSRKVMEDVAAWWVQYLLHQDDPRSFEALETVLPALGTLEMQSPLANQFRVLNLWQETLLQSRLGGDFALLQDKLLLMSTEFGKSEESDACRQLLDVHGLLSQIYFTLREIELQDERHIESSFVDLIATSKTELQAIYSEQEVPTVLEQLLVNDTVGTLQSGICNLVDDARYGSVFSYRTLRKMMQKLLLEWILTKFETPALIRLGYHVVEVEEQAMRQSRPAALTFRLSQTVAPNSSTSGLSFRLESSSTPKRSRRSAPPALATQNTMKLRRTPSNVSDDDSDATEEMSDNEANRSLLTQEENVHLDLLEARKRKKRKTKRIDIFNFDDDDDEPLDKEMLRRECLAGHRRNVSAFSNGGRSEDRSVQYQGGSDSSSSTPRRRRPFSKQEIAAIKEGHSLYGCDCSNIKAHFRQVLGDRTVLQLQDQVKYMIKKTTLSPRNPILSSRGNV